MKGSDVALTANNIKVNNFFKLRDSDSGLSMNFGVKGNSGNIVAAYLLEDLR